ncbi:uncharacterized protein LOC125241365 [Leguminivora glycinivorella]|uniref:uncharacterized protein LOC125241365 n=1 Tax=Leguminivora glycinivorella TaxID=1035111 RepID=UPI00200F8C4D|nr:uncharacterized protein LOC125241365 [Leguminivora glycinivorella]
MNLTTMWRAILNSCAIIFILTSHLDTAPVYPHSARGPRYTVSNGHETPKPFVEVRNGTFHGTGPREEARAMCSVKTLEVNATANATITRGCMELLLQESYTARSSG